MIPESWLFIAVAMLACSHLGVVMVLVVRNAWVERRLARHARTSEVFAQLHEELGARGSVVVRQELQRRQVLDDIRSLESWLDHVVAKGEDPAALSADDYDRSGIVDRYLEQLDTAQRWTRRAAAAAILGRTGSPRAVPALLRAALDGVGEALPVRAAALRSLERIHHPDAIAPLQAALASSENWFAPRAALVLARIGAPAVPPLIKELGDPSSPAAARRWAAHILGSIADRRALHVLHEALGDVDPELRTRAAKAIGEIRDASSVTPLLERLLTDPSPVVRTSVAKALGRLPTRETIDFLVSSLADGEWWVRLRAIESLGELGNPATDALRGALHDRDPLVAREAARALERIGVVTEALETMRVNGYTPNVGEFLIHVGRAGSVDGLLEALRDPTPRFVKEVVRLLSRIGDRAAGPALVELLSRDGDTALHSRVLQSLVAIRARGHVRQVLPLLRSPDSWVRTGAVEYLQRFAGAADLPNVRPMLNDPHPHTREAVLRLVEKTSPREIGDDDVDRYLSDSDVNVRAQAARTLAARGRLDRLASHCGLQDDDAMVHALVESLPPDGGPAVIALARKMFPRLRDMDLDRVAAAVRRAARSRPAELNSILADDSDPAVRWLAAVSALVVRDGLWDLRALAQDEDHRVRAAALPALNLRSTNRPEMRARLARAARDRSALVVRSAVRVLALEGGDDADERLYAVLQCADHDVAAEAAFALALRGRALEPASLGIPDDSIVGMALAAGRVFNGDPSALLLWLRSLRGGRLRTLVPQWSCDDQQLFGLMVALSDDLGAGLARRVMTKGTAHAAEMTLLESLDTSPDAAERELAVEGLRALDSRRADGTLLGVCMRDPSPRVRSAALALLLDSHDFGQRLGIVEWALRDPDESVQVAAVRRTEALEAAEAVPLLVRQLESRKARFHRAIVEQLARRTDAQPGPVLRAVLARPHTERLLVGLANVLRACNNPAPDETREMLLGHRWAAVRAAALEAFTARPGVESVERVLAAMRDPSALVRLAAIRICTGSSLPFGGREPSRREAVLRALDDPSPRVRARAALGVARLGIPDGRTVLEPLREDAHGRVARAAKRSFARWTELVVQGAPA